jgi:hypothetical protein
VFTRLWLAVRREPGLFIGHILITCPRRSDAEQAESLDDSRFVERSGGRRFSGFVLIHDALTDEVLTTTISRRLGANVLFYGSAGESGH